MSLGVAPTQSVRPSKGRAREKGGESMKKLLLILLLLAFVTPMFSSVLPGLGLATAYAGNNQGDDNDDQGDDNDDQ